MQVIQEPAVQAPAETKAVDLSPVLQEIIVSLEIVKIDMFSETNGWALSDHNLLRTADVGAEWLNASPAGEVDVGFPLSTFFLNDTSAWILYPDPADPANKGALYHSTDAGLNWKGNKVPFSAGWIFFVDDNTGFVLSVFNQSPGNADAALFRTSDGGADWERIFLTDPAKAGSLPQTASISGMTFVDANHGWITGSMGPAAPRYLYYTDDGGRTWRQRDVTANADMDGANVSTFPPVFLTRLSAVLPVMIYSSSVQETAFFVTQDAGETWLETTPLNTTVENRFSIVDLTTWVTCKPSGFDISTDAGFSWRSITPSTLPADETNRVDSLDFISGKTGWAIMIHGSGHHSLYQTLEGGYFWQPLVP